MGRRELRRDLAPASTQAAIHKILDFLGLSPPTTERPPPDVRYVDVNNDSRELTHTPGSPKGWGPRRA